MRPGTNVTTSTAIPPATAQVNTGTWFTAGPANAGPTTPTLITSFAQYQKLFGTRGTYSGTYSDSIETFFNEGGTRCYVARVVGAAAVTASLILKDGVAATALEVKASGAGLWGNALKIEVKATSETAFTIVVANATETLETSPVLTSTAEAVAWAKASPWITITITGTKSPATVAFTNLASGTDETTITTAIYETALKKFVQEYGPGQVSLPGVTTQTSVEALWKIAKEQGRVPVGDCANGASKATLKILGEAFRALAANGARGGALYADWQQVGPLSGTIGVRVVPPSPFVAAKCAVNDALGNPNLPPAGKNGILYDSLGKETNFTEPEIEELYLAGINLCKVVNGQVRLYGFRTPVSPTGDPLYLQFNNARLDMAITWKALAIEEAYFASQIDGEGNDTANYANSLSVMLLELYNKKALFGKSPQEAYAVDTGADVNTISTEAEGNLNATIACRRSPGADQVNLNITRVSITQEV
jgi:hypothetical protein